MIAEKTPRGASRVNGLLRHPTSQRPHPTSTGPSRQGHGEAFHVAAGPQGILRSCLADVFFSGLKGKKTQEILSFLPNVIQFWDLEEICHIYRKFHIAMEMVH